MPLNHSGLASSEKAELTTAKRRVTELEMA
jgi:hypothetical protein